MSAYNCATCGRPIYPHGIKDNVGRWTSFVKWLHWDKSADAEHEARP